VKEYFKKKGLRLGLTVLAVVLLIVLIKGTSENKVGVFGSVTGEIRKPFQSTITSIVNWFEKGYNRIFKYDELVAENEQLKKRLAEAESQIDANEQAIKENEQLKTLLQFKNTHSDYELELVQVTDRSSSNWSSSITINRGSNNNISVGNTIITEEGYLVGQVTEVGANWATVCTIIDPSMKIGAKTIESSATGVVQGDFNLLRSNQTRLSYIGSNDKVFEGDRVITTGSGGVFPEGLVIGTITEIASDAGGQEKYAIVSPSCDISNLTLLFVIKNFNAVS
jgi:rod shape-determining protein MreC